MPLNRTIRKAEQKGYEWRKAGGGSIAQGRYPDWWWDAFQRGARRASTEQERRRRELGVTDLRRRVEAIERHLSTPPPSLADQADLVGRLREAANLAAAPWRKNLFTEAADAIERHASPNAPIGTDVDDDEIRTERVGGWSK